MVGYSRSLAAKAAGIKGKRFDWIKAATILHERGEVDASAGLAEDWGCTSCEIVSCGVIVEERGCGYLGSLWATPILVIGDEEIECFTDDGSDFLWWPKEARDIYEGSGAP